MASNEKYKNMTFGFYISGQDDQTQPLVTKDLFAAAIKHYQQVIINQKSPWVETIEDGRTIKLSPITVDLNTGLFWGAISRKRLETLPYLGSDKDYEEKKLKCLRTIMCGKEVISVISLMMTFLFFRRI
ncbi:hypothetical protein ACK3ZC_09495 [Aeromonas caviae]